MGARRLTADEHARIASAIASAEARTAGEIYCVLARRSGSYFFPAAFMLAFGILVSSLGAALLADRWWFMLDAAHLVLIQLAALLVAIAALAFFPGLASQLVPRRLLYRTAHDNAVRQFLARNVHRTEARTGVLIFVSMTERYATVLADSGIAAKVRQSAWDGMVADLTKAAAEGRVADGFVTVVGAAGALLSAHFPVEAADRNELDDHLVEL